MNGIERVKFYTEIKTEAPYALDLSASLSDPARMVAEAPVGWPQHGDISFRGVSARYRPGLDLVLDDVSFEVTRLHSCLGSCSPTLVLHLAGCGFKCLLARRCPAARRLVFVAGRVNYFRQFCTAFRAAGCLA